MYTLPISLSDAPLQPVGLGEVKELPEMKHTEEEEEIEEDPANIPFYEV